MKYEKEDERKIWIFFSISLSQDIEQRSLSSALELLFEMFLLLFWASQGAQMVKNLPANAGDSGSIPGADDPLEKEREPTPVFLGLPRTKEPGGLQFVGSTQLFNITFPQQSNPGRVVPAGPSLQRPPSPWWGCGGE